MLRSRLSHLSRADLDVEVVPFVGDLQDLGPGEPVDPESVSVDQQAAAAHAQHDGHALRVLHTTHVTRLPAGRSILVLAVRHEHANAVEEPQPDGMASRTRQDQQHGPTQRSRFLNKLFRNLKQVVSVLTGVFDSLKSCDVSGYWVGMETETWADI